uniref:Uncharacterized protein n=1 Tax=Physcomitrium patens TaxID=3218 RepID=A0A2K1KPZ6_PHYPA|nr:hypothetical protein PHYPA_006718 [Physcomitrium patens]
MPKALCLSNLFFMLVSLLIASLHLTFQTSTSSLFVLLLFLPLYLFCIFNEASSSILYQAIHAFLIPIRIISCIDSLKRKF